MMRYSTYLLLLAIASGAAAQDSTVRVVGRVHAHKDQRPIVEAQVTMFDDTLARPPADFARTSESGLFVMPGVRPGRHLLVVRRIGYRVAMRMIDVRPESRDTVDVELYQAMERTPDDSIKAALAEADWQRRLGAARSRPRHWTCERRPAVVREYAEAWAWLGEATARQIREGEKNPWSLPTDSVAFVRNFRPIVDKAECARIGVALDQARGLISDSLTIFRMGNVYLMPNPDPGTATVLDLKGKIISGYIIPD